MPNRTRLRAIIIAHDAHVTGGVNNFLRIMRAKYRPRVESIRFINGRREGEIGRKMVLSRMLRDYIRFIFTVLANRYDILHLNPSMDSSSAPRELIFVWICRLFSPKTKIVIFYRGWSWTSFEEVQRSRTKKLLFRATQLLANRVLVLSTSFKAALIQLGVPEEKIYLTTTMFEGDMFALNEVKALAHQSNIVFLSRFLREKGGHLLIDAFSRLTSQYPDLRLVMAGDGPERSALETQARALGVSRRVEFTGHVSGARKMDLLTSAKIFALPTSHPEGMPNALLEAMAAGLPVVSTAIGGIPEVVRDGTNGILLKVIDVDSLVKALQKYLDDPALWLRTSTLNVSWAWENFESQKVADRMADHYYDMCRV